MRDRGKAVYLCHDVDIRSPWSHTGPESRANQFAANLLMPESMFKSRARSRPMTFDTVNDLASEFQTSRTATAIRLVELGSYPAMLVCYGVDGRRWYTSGRDVPNVFWPHKELNHDTEAFTLLIGQPKQSRPLLADADSWIDHRSSIQYTITEHSIRVGTDVLVLLWWKDESQILNLQI